MDTVLSWIITRLHIMKYDETESESNKLAKTTKLDR